MKVSGCNFAPSKQPKTLKQMKKIFNRYKLPGIAVMCFNILGYIAIATIVFLHDGYIPSVSEVFLSKPICYFWIGWTILIYYCAYGVLERYTQSKETLRSKIPAITEKDLITLSISQLSVYFSTKLAFVFGALPIAYLLLKYANGSEYSSSAILCIILLFFIDILVLRHSKKIRQSLFAKYS